MLVLPEGSPTFPGVKQVASMTENRSIEPSDDSPRATVATSDHPGDAARALISALHRDGEGVWEFYPQGVESPSIAIEVSSSILVDLKLPERRSVLHRALLRDSLMKSKEIERLERKGLERQQCPGILCLEEGKVDSSAAGESIAREISADLQTVLIAGEGVWRGPLSTSIGSGLQEFVDLGLTPEQALLRSARQHDLWDASCELPLMREVVTASPSAFGLVSDPTTSAEARSLLESADGLQDLAALTGHRADPWRALDRALELLGAGHLQFQSAMHLFQLGEQKLASGDSETALRHWRRAEEKGLDDFDLAGRIGQICARSGRRSEALGRLRQHARKSLEQMRFEAARLSWTELACLDPNDAEGVDRAVQLWIKEPGGELTPCLELAEVLSHCGRWQTVAELTEGVGVQSPDSRLHEWHEKAANALGDGEMELRARWRRAECLRTGSDPLSAIDHYQRLLDQNFDTVRVSLRLADLMLQQSEVEEARGILESLLTGSNIREIWEDEELQNTLQSCAEHDDVPISALDLLHQMTFDQGKFDSSRDYLLRIIQRSNCDLEISLAEYRTQVWVSRYPDDFEVLEQLLTNLHSHSTPARVGAIVESTLERMQLTPTQRIQLINGWLECDPSQPQALTLLFQEGNLEQSQKVEHFRRACMRAAANSTEIPSPEKVGLPEDEGWRAPLLKALFCGGVKSAADVEELMGEMSRDPEYLQRLLLDRSHLDPAARDRVQQHAPNPRSTIPSRNPVVRTNLGGITEKLKNIGSGGPEASPSEGVNSAPNSTAPSGDQVKAHSSPASAPGIQSALHRLKAMRQPEELTESAGNTSGTEGDSEDSPRPEPPAAPQANVNAAIARLGALRNGGNLSTDVDAEGSDP